MVRLDEKDIAILQTLSRDGRLTKTELAERVGLSASPCWERLRKLEASGIIDGYEARINLKKLGSSVTVFVTVEIANHTAAGFRVFEDTIKRHDEIVACWALGGGFDYILQVVTKDIDSYQRLIDELLDAKAGLARYFSYIVTKPVKRSGTIPFESLLDSHEAP